jgi:opacity protein-like surface antigen
MRFARALLGLALLAFGADASHAQGLDLSLRGTYQPSYAGIKDVTDIPAPIPVPMARPVPEGFSYYLRVDGGYGTQADKPSFSEAGRTYGAGGANPFNGTATFGYNGSGFSSVRNEQKDLGFGGVGFGAYLSPMLRGDVTVEFRSPQTTDIYGAYNYTSTIGAAAVNGTLRDTVEVQSTLGLVNGYIDLLPRGAFSPYIGGGVGMAYHQVNRTYLARETSGASAMTVGGTGTTNRAAFAAAGMAGVTFAFDHRWAIDVNYRALYLQGTTVSLTTTGLATNQASKAIIGDSWEHQVRVGLRFNIW